MAPGALGLVLAALSCGHVGGVAARNAWRMGAGPGATLPLRLFNTLARRKEALVLQTPGEAKFYSCGPTVYDFAHVGNFRAFLTYDVLKRWLAKGHGVDVTHILNLTDVDDKILVRMQAEGLGLQELTRKFEAYFKEDLVALNVVLPTAMPRATDHMDDIIAMIDDLIQQGYAYSTPTGSVYFEVQQQKSYGRLSRLRMESVLDGASEGGGISEGAVQDEKRNAKDFALWKARKDEDGEVSWNAPWGAGRPGWHIECSAMARRFLGNTLDLHAGGVDLVFPHHENEMAQSEAANGAPFCNCWVHNGFVNIDGEKMSKSLGNFRTLRDVCKDPAALRGFRLFVVSSQYRSPLNFNPESLKAATNAIKRLDRLVSGLDACVATGAAGDAAHEQEDLETTAGAALEDFRTAMDDDLNTPRAYAALFKLVKAAEGALKAAKKAEKELAATQAATARESLRTMDETFGFFYAPEAAWLTKGKAGGDAKASTDGEAERIDVASLPENVQTLIVSRGEAKNAKDWAEADRIRSELLELGFTLKDAKSGEVEVSRV